MTNSKLFTLLSNQLEAMDKAILTELDDPDRAVDILDMVGAEMYMVDRLMMHFHEQMEDPPEPTPDGISPDDPNKEDEDERETRKRTDEQRGYYSRI